MKIHKSEMRNQKCEMRNSKGFSLIELVFAMSFLTIIILGVISLQTSNLAMLNSQNNVIQAHFYANQALEITSTLSNSLSDADFEINFSGSNYSLNAPTGPKGALIDGTDFYRKITADDTDLTSAYKVIAIISWEDGTGEHEILAKRIISQ